MDKERARAAKKEALRSLIKKMNSRRLAKKQDEEIDVSEELEGAVEEKPAKEMAETPEVEGRDDEVSEEEDFAAYKKRVLKGADKKEPAKTMSVVVGQGSQKRGRGRPKKSESNS